MNIIEILEDFWFPKCSMYQHLIFSTWWHHQMETFSVLLALCVWNSPVTGEFPSQRPVTWSFDVFFDLRLKKRLSKQSWGWWFEMPWCSLWCRSNDKMNHLSNTEILILLSAVVLIRMKPYSHHKSCKSWDILWKLGELLCKYLGLKW